MKKILLVLAFSIVSCNLPVSIVLEVPATATASMPPLLPSSTPAPTAQPGTTENPLVLALAPSPRPDPQAIEAAEKLSGYLASRTGYRIVNVAPANEAQLVEAFKKNDAQIASLSPFGYLLAREDNSVTAILGASRNGETFYGAQIIANRESKFTAYYSAERGENTADVKTALAQFAGKKACWSDMTSPSGYVIPLAALNQAQIKIRGAAFLDGQASVVRAVYAADICDFGGTYIDARQLPALEANYPDVNEKVVIIWRIPKIIPYENISVSNKLPLEMRRAIQRAFIDLMLTPDGPQIMQTVYGIDTLTVVEDAMYGEFQRYAKDSGLNLPDLLK